MISKIDIDEMNEKVVAPRSYNHVGYGVQYLHPDLDWQCCSVVFALREMAIRACVALEEFNPTGEFRVYEVVK